jgi:hypothetical protein
MLYQLYSATGSIVCSGSIMIPEGGRHIDRLWTFENPAILKCNIIITSSKHSLISAMLTV